MNFRHTKLGRSPRLLILVIASLVGVTSLSAQSGQADALAAGIPVSGRTVILGTWTWDIENNFQGRSKTTDIWWQQMDDVRQALVPIGGSALARVVDRDYASLTIEDLVSLKYSRRPIENTQLEEGTLLAMRTAEGNFAKIRIIGYRELHDMWFDDAKYLSNGWKHGALTRPNRLKYHLEVEWTIYPGAPRAL